MGSLGGRVKVLNHQPHGALGEAAARVSLLLLRSSVGVLAALLLLAASQAEARGLRSHGHARHASPGPSFALVSESIVIDVETGRVLSAMNADAITYPASLTKMMTLYLVFEALNAGRLRTDQYLPVSYEAASRSPTKLGLRPGESLAVQELILGLVTRSANDAAAVLAEGLAGSEPAFAEQMTRRARQLGMTSTVYRNASGLPNPDQYTTARDQAQLALALYRDFPREYRYFATRQFYFRGNVIHNHNHLLDWYEGADGIKTGYIGASGYNLAASAVRNEHRLIGVVMGGPSPIVAEAEQSQPAPSREKPGVLSRAASRVAARLSPIAKAEAATVAHEQRTVPAGEHWSIQLGAFRGEDAAEKAGRTAALLPTAKGKPLQIVAPAKSDKDRFYRTRLLNFTSQEAWGACIALHKKDLECSVVSPAGVKVANR